MSRAYCKRNTKFATIDRNRRIYLSSKAYAYLYDAKHVIMLVISDEEIWIRKSYIEETNIIKVTRSFGKSNVHSNPGVHLYSRMDIPNGRYVVRTTPFGLKILLKETLR